VAKKFMKNIEKLIKAAKQAVKYSYAPYSKFKVGAAVLTDTGKIFAGANIENASYGLTICAERVALFKVVSEGEKKFKALAIYTNTKDFTYPCGACLQVIAEFSPNLYIILINSKGEIRQYTLSSLIPYQFSKNHLK
jgi:cytidine deaminase